MSKTVASREFGQKLHSCLQECPLILQVFSPPPPSDESPKKEAASPLPGDEYSRILPQVSIMAHHYEIFSVLKYPTGSALSVLTDLHMGSSSWESAPSKPVLKPPCLLLGRVSMDSPAALPDLPLPHFPPCVQQLLRDRPFARVLSGV